MEFVDIKNDIAFRKIFGNENKKIILISFINAVMELEGLDKIKDITILNPFQLPILSNMKVSIIDVKATDNNNNTYIVEMQVADVIGMEQRVLYYTSKEYSQQIDSGEKYTELKPVIFIGIFDYKFSENKEYLSHHAFCNVNTGERVIKDMNMYFIELEKFDKAPKALQTVTDKWIYFIKEVENLEVIPENIDDEGLVEAYKDANKNTWTKQELDAYNYAAMREQDDKGRTAKAKLDGRIENKKEMVLKPYIKGKTVEAISDFLDISVVEIQGIINEYERNKK